MNVQKLTAIMSKNVMMKQVCFGLRVSNKIPVFIREASSDAKRDEWSPSEKLPNSIEKAQEHYDDFYSTVFGKHWPSMRLGLLTEAKYVAIPNPFLDNIEQVKEKLGQLGAFDMKEIWISGREKIKADRKDFDTKKNLERMKEMDRKLESIATSRAVEEMDILYKSAPDRKRQMTGTDVGSERRVMSDVREASQEYVSATKLKGLEEFQLESEYFSTYSGQGIDTSVFKYTNPSNYARIEFPPFIRPMIFEAGSPSSFPASGKESVTDLRNYLCINGASISPLLALDLKPDVTMLDLCAGPGTKSLLALMTMCPSTLTCNDLERSRILRIYRLFDEFIGTSKPSNVTFTKSTAADYPNETKYDRVLADVPCLMDRISLTVADNSIFKSTRIKERLGLVQIQKRILLSGLKCLAPHDGSTCVYSTCTLSPIENDGVVGAALRETEVPNLHIDMKGVWEALLPFKLAGLFNLSRTKFGVLIQPNVISNVGPMYVSRIVAIPSNL